MIDVADKEVTERTARARAVIRLSEETLQRIQEGRIPKGDVLAVARVAGIQAAKDTARFLPLCHPIPLEGVEIDFAFHTRPSGIEIETSSRATWKTGVEMEALTAAAAAALTIYDMCKSIERGISIESIELLEKRGGRTGTWVRD